MRILKASSFIEKLVDADLKLKRLVELRGREFVYEYDPRAKDDGKFYEDLIGSVPDGCDFYVDLFKAIRSAGRTRGRLRKIKKRAVYFDCFGGMVVVSKSDVEYIKRAREFASEKHGYFSNYLVGSEGDNTEAEDGDYC
jgi:hypothetical protein